MGLLKIYLIGALFLGTLLLCTAAYQVHHYDFVLKETNFTRLCTTKSMLTVNGSFPGPVIRVRKGDLVYVNVHNQGKYGVTIHWHGVKQPRNPWSDGPENVTQCPIQPGSSFTYEVILSDEEGTLWWHAHSDWSRATVHGAFVILPPAGKTYPFPKPYQEQIIVLGSWYNGDLKTIIDVALESGGFPSTSNAHTINGYTGVSNTCSTAQTYHMRVKYGKTYLLRIVNAVMNEEQFFAIANHTLTLVGMDGAYTKPITRDFLFITPGQTMDVLVNANKSPTQYYMVSSSFYDGFAPFDNTSATAIFEYEGNYTPPAPSTNPYPNFPSYNDGIVVHNFTSLLRSLASDQHPVDVPKTITKQIFIAIALNILPCPTGRTCSGPSNQIMSASLNNISFVTPQVDILEAYYRSLGNIFSKDFPIYPPNFFDFTGDVTNISRFTTPGTRVITVPYGEAVEIILQGTNIQSPENHPIHLHGFSFYLVGLGTGNFNNVTDPQKYNLVDPPHINTVAVPKNGWAAIRFTANNPGVWFMHCHLERHASWGMDTVIVVKNGTTETTSIRPRPAYMPPCSATS